VLHKLSQNIFKNIEDERQEFLMEGETGLSLEEAWRWKSLGVIPHWGKDTNIILWLDSKEVKVENVKDLDKVPHQFDEDTGEEYTHGEE